jgi:hypothetical protein
MRLWTIRILPKSTAWADDLGRTVYLPLAESATKTQARETVGLFLDRGWKILDIAGPDDAVGRKPHPSP